MLYKTEEDLALMSDMLGRKKEAADWRKRADDRKACENDRRRTEDKAHAARPSCLEHGAIVVDAHQVASVFSATRPLIVAIGAVFA